MESNVDLYVISVHESTESRWSFLFRNLPANAPPQKVIRISEESMEWAKHNIAGKVIKRYPGYIMVICKDDVFLPTGKVTFLVFENTITKDNKDRNIEYLAGTPSLSKEEIMWKELDALIIQREYIDAKIKAIFDELRPSFFYFKI